MRRLLDALISPAVVLAPVGLCVAAYLAHAAGGSQPDPLDCPGTIVPMLPADPAILAKYPVQATERAHAAA